jgi:CSLREA domain-containing protein
MPRNQQISRARGFERVSDEAPRSARRSCIVAASAVAFLLTTAFADAATITVNSVADPNPGTTLCVLRDAITAANTKAKIDGCAAGSGSDTINFSVSGTIELGSTLPTITNTPPSSLTIDGTGQSITISGQNLYRVMDVGLVGPATVKLANLTIANGNSGDEGGGILSNRSTSLLSVSNCTFADNNAGFTGGGIDNEGGTLTVTNSTFIGNSAPEDGGGGIQNNGGGTLTVANSTFTNNSAPNGGAGGGIQNNGTLTIINSTFSGNSTSGSFSFGGGVAAYNQTVAVTNSTFVGNSASGSNSFGGGIGAIAGPVTVKGTLLADNGSGGNCGGEVQITDSGYNLSDDASCDFSATGSQNNVPDTSSVPGTALNLDPSGLQNNGGPTQTIALEGGSLATDAIPVASCQDVNVNPCTNPPTTSAAGPLVCDQRGEPRPGSGESACAIGAFEPQTLAEFAEFDTGLIVFPKQFAAGGSFTLAADAPTFNPPTQAVTVTLSSAAFGPLAATIPAGHFTLVKGQYRYSGTLGGVKYGASISAPVHGVYEFTFAVFGVDVTGITNPVSVTLQIGSNIGTDDVAAAIL